MLCSTLQGFAALCFLLSQSRSYTLSTGHHFGFATWTIILVKPPATDYHTVGIFRKGKFSFALKTTIFASLILVLSIKIESTPTYNKIILSEVFIPIDCWTEKTKFWPAGNFPLYGTFTAWPAFWMGRSEFILLLFVWVYFVHVIVQ